MIAASVALYRLVGPTIMTGPVLAGLLAPTSRETDPRSRRAGCRRLPARPALLA